MTYLLKTINHGVVESGFRSFYFGRLIGIGEYGISPKDFCKRVYHLSTKNIFATNIPTLNEKQVETQCQINVNNLLTILNEDSVEDTRKWLESEDKFELDIVSTIQIPIRVSNDESKIEIGKYELEQNKFADFSRYVADGGFLGWGMNKKDTAPRWAKLTKEAIERSNRKLFKLGN